MRALTSLLCLTSLCCLWQVDYFPSPSGIPASFSLQIRVVLELQPFVQWLFRFMVAPHIGTYNWSWSYDHYSTVIVTWSKLGCLAACPDLWLQGQLNSPHLPISRHLCIFGPLHSMATAAYLTFRRLAPTAEACLPWSFSRKLLGPESFLPKVRHRYFLAKPGKDGLMWPGSALQRARAGTLHQHQEQEDSKE